mmetsp:Transcript_8132/g.36820  ORF Transcript_8132/g.36820 Transcript_8132/m.36820 type:complete len:218 (+) Transcript_8132:409-1062(+)
MTTTTQLAATRSIDWATPRSSKTVPSAAASPRRPPLPRPLPRPRPRRTPRILDARAGRRRRCSSRRPRVLRRPPPRPPPPPPHPHPHPPPFGGRVSAPLRPRGAPASAPPRSFPIRSTRRTRTGRRRARAPTTAPTRPCPSSWRSTRGSASRGTRTRLAGTEKAPRRRPAASEGRDRRTNDVNRRFPRVASPPTRARRGPRALCRTSRRRAPRRWIR